MNNNLNKLKFIDATKKHGITWAIKYYAVEKIRYKRLYDKTYPIIYGTIGVAAVWYWQPNKEGTQKFIENVLPNTLTVAAVLAGFLATAQSVLISNMRSMLWKKLKRYGYDKDLINYHWEAIVSLFATITTIIVVTYIYTYKINHSNYSWLIPAVLWGLIIHSGLSSYRIMKIMSKIMTKISDE